LAKPTTSPAILATATPATIPSGAKGKGKLDRGTSDVTASPAEESGKTNLNAPKTKATAPPPNLDKEKGSVDERGRVKAAGEGGKKPEKKGEESPTPTPQ
jgi:hypothetical protein